MEFGTVETEIEIQKSPKASICIVNGAPDDGDTSKSFRIFIIRPLMYA